MYTPTSNNSQDKNIPTKKVTLPYEKEKAGKKAKQFLRGPINYLQLVKASNLPGRAIHVFIVICFLYGVTKSRTFKLKSSLLREFGVKRCAGYVALKALENAGLVSVVRRNGCNPMVTILEAIRIDTLTENKERGSL
ncbi:MAG: hypothetical protein HOB18_00135 [Nitrospina sp.]|nr:hypothetical protein [Nitrospina sp.]